MTNSWYSHKLRVRYQETDKMGVVYHANYLNWFEIGRTEWVREKGIPYQQFEERGFFLPVVDLGMTFKQPAYYDEIVDVQTRLKELTNLRIAFEVRILREDAVLVEGWTKHVWVDRRFKPVRLDKAAPDLYERISQGSRLQ